MGGWVASSRSGAWSAGGLRSGLRTPRKRLASQAPPRRVVPERSVAPSTVTERSGVPPVLGRPPRRGPTPCPPCSVRLWQVPSRPSRTRSSSTRLRSTLLGDGTTTSATASPPLNSSPGPFCRGSFARKTMINPLNDVDVVLVLPRFDEARLRRPGGPVESMEQLKPHLTRCYPGVVFDSGKRADHALRLDFPDTGFHIDLVPAFDLFQRQRRRGHRRPQVGSLGAQQHPRAHAGRQRAQQRGRHQGALRPAGAHD